VFHGPKDVNYFYHPRWLDYWQFRNILPPNTLDSFRLPVTAAVLKASPFLKWFIGKYDFDFPYIEYFKVRDSASIDLVHSNLRLLVHDKPWVLVFDSPALLTCIRMDTKKLRYRRYPIVSETLTRKLMFSKFLTNKLVFSKTCKKIIPFSEKAKEEFLMLFDAPQEKIEVIPPGIEIPKIVKKRKRDELCILFVGRRFYRKGGKLLLDAFMKLSAKYDHLRLVLKTRTKASSMRLDDLARIREDKRISWISTQTPDTMDSLYANADILVLPTRMDFFGQVVLEAMSFELPVIATNVYAIPEIVKDQETGFLIPKDDSKALEEKLKVLIESESLRRRMGRAGRERVEKNFSNSVVNKRLKTVYEEALKS